MEKRTLKTIKGYSQYMADSVGNLYKDGHLIAQHIRKDGYFQASIYKDNGKRVNVLIHRLVLMAFDPIDKFMQVNHKDGNKQNNNIENLEWVTPAENSQHAYKFKLKLPPKGESNGRSKLTVSQVIEIRRILDSGEMSCKAMARKLNMSDTAIERIKNRYSWRHIDG